MTKSPLDLLDEAERALTNHTPDDPLAETTLAYNQFHAYAELINNNIRALIDIARAAERIKWITETMIECAGPEVGCPHCDLERAFAKLKGGEK